MKELNRLCSLRVLCCVVLVCLGLTQLCSGQDNRGQIFFLCFLENRVLLDLPKPRIFITSLSEVTIQVSIRVPRMSNYPDEMLTLKPGQTIIHDFGYDLHMIQTSQSYKGVLIESNGYINIQGASINDLSTDAFLALPFESLGHDYYVMSYMYKNVSQNIQGPSQLAILGTQDATMIEITLPRPGIEIINTIYTFTDLKAKFYIDFCQVIQFQSRQDLSGTRVRATKPVAVFSGDVWVSIRADHMGDHLLEQIPPTKSWGQEFYGAPVATRTSGDVYRVLASRSFTAVRVERHNFNLNHTITVDIFIDKAEFYEFLAESAESVYVLANQPVLLVQFCKSYSADEVRLSDPFMAVVPPVAQYLNAYVYHTLTTLFDKDDYIHFLNLMVPTTEKDGIRIDGHQIPAESFNKTWTPIASSCYSYAQILVKPGRHIIYHINVQVKFGTIAYGLKFQESYGHTLGQTLDALPFVCIKTKMKWADLFDNDCDGRLDEEVKNGIDDDGDGLIDEDIFDENTARDPNSIIHVEDDELHNPYSREEEGFERMFSENTTNNVNNTGKESWRKDGPAPVSTIGPDGRLDQSSGHFSSTLDPLGNSNNDSFLTDDKTDSDGTSEDKTDSGDMTSGNSGSSTIVGKGQENGISGSKDPYSGGFNDTYEYSLTGRDLSNAVGATTMNGIATSTTLPAEGSGGSSSGKSGDKWGSINGETAGSTGGTGGSTQGGRDDSPIDSTDANEEYRGGSSGHVITTNGSNTEAGLTSDSSNKSHLVGNGESQNPKDSYGSGNGSLSSDKNVFGGSTLHTLSGSTPSVVSSTANPLERAGTRIEPSGSGAGVTRPGGEGGEGGEGERTGELVSIGPVNSDKVNGTFESEGLNRSEYGKEDYIMHGESGDITSKEGVHDIGCCNSSSGPNGNMTGSVNGTGSVNQTNAASKSDKEKKVNLLFVIIPLCVLFGLPLCCCIFCCGRSCYLGKNKMKRKNKKVSEATKPEKCQMNTMKIDSLDVRMQQQDFSPKLQGIMPFTNIKSKYEVNTSKTKAVVTNVRKFSLENEKWRKKSLTSSTDSGFLSPRTHFNMRSVSPTEVSSKLEHSSTSTISIFQVETKTSCSSIPVSSANYGSRITARRKKSRILVA